MTAIVPHRSVKRMIHTAGALLPTLFDIRHPASDIAPIADR